MGSHTWSTEMRGRMAVTRASTDDPPDGATTRSRWWTPARRRPSSTAAGRAPERQLEHRARRRRGPPERADVGQLGAPRWGPPRHGGRKQQHDRHRRPAEPGQAPVRPLAGGHRAPRPRRRHRPGWPAPPGRAARRPPVGPPTRPTTATPRSAGAAGRRSADPTSPASRPAVSPQAMMSAAAGSASRLASIPATGRPPERPTSERPHRHLGGERHAQRGRQPAGTGQVVGQRTGQHEDPGRRGDRELEPEHPDQHRIGQQQHRDRQGQRAEAGHRSPEHPGGHGDGRHHRGPQHGRLEPGHHPEEADDAPASRPTATAGPGDAAAAWPRPARRRRSLPTRRAGG